MIVSASVKKIIGVCYLILYPTLHCSPASNYSPGLGKFPVKAFFILSTR